MSDERPVYIRKMDTIIKREQKYFVRHFTDEAFEAAIKDALRSSKAKWTENDIESVTAKIYVHTQIKRVVVENLLPFSETLRLRRFDDSYDYGERHDRPGPAEWKPAEDDDA